MDRIKTLELLGEGVEAWNAYRRSSPDWIPNLAGESLRNLEARGIDLSNSHLNSTDFSGSVLSDSKFRGAQLQNTWFREATLSNVSFREANLESADFSRSFLHRTRFVRANLRGANLSESDATEALFVQSNLEEVSLNHANLSKAHINGCRIWGVAAWDLDLQGARQSYLIVTRENAQSPVITVDDFEVAQFVHLLLNNVNLRRVLDAVATRAVLILGRFTAERKQLLEGVRLFLKEKAYIPIIFDFEGSKGRDTTETVSTLAHLSYFVIADVTEPRGVPQELSQIVPHLPSVLVQPLLQRGYPLYEMFDHFQRYPWVLKVLVYSDLAELQSLLHGGLLDSIERDARELRRPSSASRSKNTV